MEPLTLFGLGTNIMFSLGIVFAIVFIIFYMRQRFSEYNHKLNSMFQLISAMADELNVLKQKKSQSSDEETKENDEQLMKLIVSDDEDSESDSDSDSDNESVEDVNNVDYNNVIIENNTLTIDNNLEQSVGEEVSQDIANQGSSSDIKLIEITSDVETQDNVDVNKLNVKQLRDLLTQKGLSFEQNAKKKDLIKLLEENDN